VSYLEVEQENNSFPVRIMIGVPKKRFKKAVDRNRIKRQIREVYRKNKQFIVEVAIEQNRFYHVSFQYVANDILPHVEMNVKMIKTLGKLQSLFFEKTLNEYETDKTDN
jgi:ribonuclease P protein component